MPTVLIELSNGAGVVRRDDGEIVVTYDVSDYRGQPLRGSDRYQPVKTLLHDESCLVGGLLPAGAVTAEVLDDRGARVAAVIGGGAYAAILEQSNDPREPVVCCRDASGMPVRRPLPDGYPCAPVDDAEEPCPACGAVDYEECVPTENKLTLRAVTFPIYAAEGWPARIKGSGSHGDELAELTIAHTDTEDADLFDGRPRIEVTTSVRRQWLVVSLW